MSEYSYWFHAALHEYLLMGVALRRTQVSYYEKEKTGYNLFFFIIRIRLPF